MVVPFGIVGILALVFCQSQSLSTEQIFASAARDLNAGRMVEAEAGFQDVLRREPNNLGALGNLGVLYIRQDRPQKAIEIYRRAIRLAPKEPGLLLNLGLAYLKLDDHAQAKPLFAELVSSGPQERQRQAQELLAICQLQTGETASAIATLETLSQSPGASPGVHHFLALAYVKRGDLPRAQVVLSALFASLPAAQAHYLEGRVWYDSANFDRALASFEKAQKADAALAGLALEIGKTHVSLRNNTVAAEQFRAALAQNPDDVEAKYFLGALLVQEGQYDQAAPLLTAVTESRPDLWGTHYYLGKAQLLRGHPAAALPLLQRAAKQAPNESSVQYQLARALQALGRRVESQQVFARVARLKANANPDTIQMK